MDVFDNNSILSFLVWRKFMIVFDYVFQVSMFVHINSMVDEYMSCDRLFGGSGEGAKARSARHLLEAIPCDMKKQSFCANKGTAYPE